MTGYIKIELAYGSDDELAKQALKEFCEALETMLTWQWDNVAITSYIDVTHP